MTNLTNALEKLRLSAAESRAYLITPVEARALVAELQLAKRQHELFQRGMGASVALAEAERRGEVFKDVRAQAPTPPYYWTAEMAAFLEGLAQQGVSKADDLADWFYRKFPEFDRRTAGFAVMYWLKTQETPS